MKVYKINRNKALIFALTILVVAQFVMGRFESNEIDYSHYQREYKKEQDRIEELYKDVTEQKKDIKRLKEMYYAKDDTIANATRGELRLLTREFIKFK